MNEFFGTTMPKLGFGLMRLPRLADGKTIDIEQCEAMTDAFLNAGMRYFDTAYVYEGSEEATRRFLVGRHPRESFYLADKVNASPWAAKSADEAKRELAVSLERTGAGYFDFYLLHALGSRNIGYYEDYGIWELAAKAKEQGLVRHVGFSFHDRPDVLDQILTRHPEAEFVQLQLNYGDWESPSVCSRENYEVACAHGKPVVVMEPVKGGLLANPPQQVQDILRAANPNASIASWATLCGKPGERDGCVIGDVERGTDGGQPLLHARVQATGRRRAGRGKAREQGTFRHRPDSLHRVPLLHRRVPPRRLTSPRSSRRTTATLCMAILPAPNATMSQLWTSVARPATACGVSSARAPARRESQSPRG